MTVGLALGLLVWTAAAAGCAGGPGRLTERPAFFDRRGYIPDVPFYPDDAYQCGPSSLAAVMNFHGVGVSPADVSAKVYRENLRGAVSLDLVLYARGRGLRAGWFEGTLEGLAAAVDNGLPVIVMLDMGVSLLKRFHYVVVVGYGPHGVVMNSGLDRETEMVWSRFLDRWERAGRWTLLLEHAEGAQ